MQNIERLYKRYPEKKDNVQFNCVLDPTSDIKCINDFFMNEDMLKEYRVLFNSLSREGIKVMINLFLIKIILNNSNMSCLRCSIQNQKK